jgi:poly(3-hydroxybutyrate) depolymerase
MRLTPMILCSLLLGCGDKEGGDSGGTDDTAETDGWPYAAAELAELSSGECPDMSTSGSTATFLSSGEERTVTTIFPAAPDADTKVIFFFHGLMDSSHGSPSSVFASSFGMQDIADELNAIIVLPESNIWELFGFSFYLWDVEDGTYDNDVTLYDDLRTCVYNQFAPNMDKVFSMGFSGGGLFTTIITSQRGDTLAAAVEMSGGADIDTGFLDGIVAPYATPAASVPVYLTSGGDNDVWPSSQLVVVNFETGTDTLASNLAADGHFVVRCHHDSGHTVTNADYTAAWDFVEAHEYGQPSPYLTDGIGDWSSRCEVAQ